MFHQSFIFLKTCDSEFSYIEAWFADQNSKLLQIEDKINIALVIPVGAGLPPVSISTTRQFDF